jgi:hypothetical protein
VIVPVGRGDPAWQEMLPPLLDQLPSGTEILLTTAGPAPPVEPHRRTSLTMQWVSGAAARGARLNRCAGLARGRFLWFLHADSRLDAGAAGSLLERLRAGPECLWYFDLRFEPGGPPLMGLNQWGARVRSDLLGLPFGDQGLAMARDLFLRLGGFRENVTRGEDHLLVWAARRAGARARPVGAPIYTSPRRYRDEGWLRTTSRHLWLTARQALPEAAGWIRDRWRR